MPLRGGVTDLNETGGSNWSNVPRFAARSRSDADGYVSTIPEERQERHTCRSWHPNEDHPGAFNRCLLVAPLRHADRPRACLLTGKTGNDRRTVKVAQLTLNGLRGVFYRSAHESNANSLLRELQQEVFITSNDASVTIMRAEIADIRCSIVQ
jgi:hypothetical protein